MGRIDERAWEFDEPVEWLAVSPDGLYAAVPKQRSGSVVLLDLQSGKVAWESKHKEKTHGAAFSPDGNLVLACAPFGDDRAALLDMPAGDLVRVLRGDYGAAHKWIENAEFSPDGRWVATASVDGSARISGSGNRRVAQVCAPPRQRCDLLGAVRCREPADRHGIR